MLNISHHIQLKKQLDPVVLCFRFGILGIHSLTHLSINYIF